MHKQGHYGNIFDFWHIWKKVWRRVITPLWCLKAPSPATKKWIFEFYIKFGFRNHLQTFWPRWLVKSELSLGLSDMLSFFKWMNKQHPSITFTKEEEQDNKLSFLDVLLTRTTDGSIVTSIYRKPTFSGLYMKWDSFVPKWYKKGLVHCLVFRAWKLCSSYVLFHSEILFVKELLMSNGYPANFIDSIVHRFLSKQFSNTDVMQPYGPHKRRVYLCLPYVGELATNKFARQIRRLIAKIAPCVELRLVFRAAQKLSCLTRLKSKLNILSRSGVVYQISCSQCEAFYVGKT